MRTLFLILLALYIHQLKSQSHEFGIEGAVGTNFVAFSSSDLPLQELSIESGLGIFIGGAYKHDLGKISIRNRLGFQLNHFQYEPGLLFTDINGSPIVEENKKMRNLNLFLSSLVTYDFEFGLYLGTGVGLSYLITSQMQLEIIEERFKNYQYNRLALFIPFELGYEWNKSAIFTNYFLGLTNKNDPEGSISEKESYLNIGYRYRFVR